MAAGRGPRGRPLLSLHSRVPLALALLAGAGCDGPTEVPILPSPPPAITVPDGFVAETFAAGLSLPTSIAFPPDGSDRLFVNELQTGRVRIVRRGELLAQPFARVETNTTGGFPVQGENGLVGLAFDPQYASNRYVYVTYATRTDSGTFGTVARFTDAGDRGEAFTVLLSGLPAAAGHQVQSLAFGPDGKLYVSVGDAFTPERVQDPTSFVGKVLRMNRDGTVPADNPIPGSYTFAYGLRNAFDLAFDGVGSLYTTDNGPERDDELNQLVPGGNYGWPEHLGATADPAFVAPLHVWSGIVAPTGLVYYDSPRFPARFRGKFFLVLFGRTNTPGPSRDAKRVQVVDVTTRPVSFEDFAVYDFAGTGNPVDAAVGPDGALYISDIFQGSIFRIRRR